MHWRDPLTSLSSLLLLPGAVLLTPHPPAAQPASACRAGADVVAAEMVELQPTGKIALAGGMIELKPVMSPFGLALTAEGRTIYDATVTVKNLPDPSSLGGYQTYVVWLATPSLDQIRNLGPITNERPITARVDFLKMMYIVTAETKANGLGERFAGPILLVGRSASARVQNMAGCDIYDTSGGMGG